MDELLQSPGREIAGQRDFTVSNQGGESINVDEWLFGILSRRMWNWTQWGQWGLRGFKGDRSLFMRRAATSLDLPAIRSEVRGLDISLVMGDDLAVQVC